jgi:chorismate mutase/GNAT superfamily N-acetyltransferase
MGEGADLLLRPATVADAGVVADLFLAAREASYPAMPRPVHDPESVRAWVRGWYDDPAHVEPLHEAWVAERDGEVVGYLMLERSWLHSLYVRPGLTGRGIGGALLDLAKALRPEGLGLYVFESNEGARRFYAARGFTEVARHDGRDNEEQAPDVEMCWGPEPTLRVLRARIDDVDARLADLLELRAELSARVQQVKPVAGRAGRDPDREAEIVARMAARAPRLGADRLRRIMHAVIGESLDAAEPRDDRPGQGTAGE